MAIKAGNRKPIDRSMVIIVVGEPSSGTRLVKRMLDESPSLDAVHDNYHGRRKWNSGQVVIVTRDEEARQASVEARWPGGIDEFNFPSTDKLREDYPDAYEIAFEDVISNLSLAIEDAATFFGCPVWEFDEEIYDANDEDGTRETYDNAVERKRTLLEKAGKL